MRPLSILMLTLFLAGCGLAGRGAVDAPLSEAGVPDRPAPEEAPIPRNVYLLEEDDDVIGEIQVVRTIQKDTFVDIARAYGVGFDELVAANPGVDPWLPGAGTPVVLPTRFVLPAAAREGIVLNVATMRLFYFPQPEIDGPMLVETYPVGIGRSGWQTPTGDTTIVSKARDPIWYVPRSVRDEHLAAGDPLPRRMPPGPDNPLGKYVLGLGIPGYLIHGTNKPAGVGMRISHGCVRLYPEDIEHLFQQIDKGTRVRIVNQPYLLGWQGGDLLLETHRPLEEDQRDWNTTLPIRARASLVEYIGDTAVIDEERMRQIASESRGFPVSVLAGRPDTLTQVREARQVQNIISYDQVAIQFGD